MAAISTARTARLGLRATSEPETVLRCAAEVAHKSLTDFILDAAYQADEHAALHQLADPLRWSDLSVEQTLRGLWAGHQGNKR